MMAPATRRPLQLPRDGWLPKGRNVSQNAGFSLALFGISLFLFVIHSFRLPVGQLAIGIGLLGVLLEARKPVITRQFVVILLFGAWAALSFALVPHPSASTARLTDFLKTIVVYALVLNSIRTRRQLHWFCLVFLAMFALFPVRGSLMNMIFGIGEAGRFAWNETFGNPNDLAGYSLLLLGIAGAMLKSSSQKWIRLCSLIGLLLLPIIIFFTQSRGAILGLAAGLLIIFASEQKKFRLLVLAGVAATLIAVLAPEAVWDRLAGLKNINSENLREVDAEGSAEQRLTIWKTALAISADHRLLGVGFGNYPIYNYEYAAERPEFAGACCLKDTHSMYLNVLAETGVVGLLLLLAFIGFTFQSLLRSVRLARSHRGSVGLLAGSLPLMAALVAFLVATVFGTLHHTSHFLLFMVTCERWATVSLRDAAVKTQRVPADRGLRRPFVARRAMLNRA